MTAPPVTPDGRYLVVRGRLWRCANPTLPEDRRAALVRQLMDGRRAVAQAKRAEAKGEADPEALAAARATVDAAKTALGERGPVWWTDGAPDLNRHMARTTPYAAWFAGLSDGER
jgi:hypothetical protein